MIAGIVNSQITLAPPTIAPQIISAAYDPGNGELGVDFYNSNTVGAYLRVQGSGDAGTYDITSTTIMNAASGGIRAFMTGQTEIYLLTMSLVNEAGESPIVEWYCDPFGMCYEM